MGPDILCENLERRNQLTGTYFAEEVQYPLAFSGVLKNLTLEVTAGTQDECDIYSLWIRGIDNNNFSGASFSGNLSGSVFILDRSMDRSRPINPCNGQPLEENIVTINDSGKIQIVDNKDLIELILNSVQTTMTDSNGNTLCSWSFGGTFVKQ